MRFLNIKMLKQELRTGSLTENDGFAYFFAIFILETLFINSSFVFSSEAEFSWLDVASILVPTFIAVTVTWLLYQTNGGKNGKHFFLRYFSILWVMGVRFFLPSTLMFASWFGYLSFYCGDYKYEWEFFTIGNIMYAIFYWRVWVHMREVQIEITT
jgi:hypothetical protein